MAQARVKVISNRMKVRAYITHKQAEKYSDCADYFGICPLNKRVAVSDGVSQSIMPLEWAKILVNAFINNSWDPETGVSSLQSEWFKEAIAYLNDKRAQGKNPWMLENCITNRDGAGATFCGIEFVDDSHWTAKILGDSCLVLLDENNEILKIVSSKEGKFDNRPDYFDSFKEQRGAVKTEVGELKGHKILLVSDPFSELFQNYQTSVEIKVIIDRILSLSGYNSYVQLVDEYRELYHMHNDDSTLVIIEYDKKAEFDILEQYKLDLLQENEIKAEKAEEAKKKVAKELDDNNWQKALKSNTIESYQEYLNSSDLIFHTRDAEKCIAALKNEKEEQDDWENAQNQNSIESYSKYLKAHPQGKYSKEAEELVNKIKKSSGGARENDQKEPSEPSSEDEDRCGQVNNTTNVSSLLESNMEQNSKINSTTPASPATGEEGSESTCPATGEEGSESANPASGEEGSKSTCPASGEESSESASPATSEEGSESASPATGEEGSESASSTTATSESATTNRVNSPWNKGYTQQVAKQEVSTGIEEITIPASVDSSDGIDRQEFHEIFSTAVALFKKHSTSFEEALIRKKWNQSECFRKFWLELEEIIYNSHG